MNKWTCSVQSSVTVHLSVCLQAALDETKAELYKVIPTELTRSPTTRTTYQAPTHHLPSHKETE